MASDFANIRSHYRDPSDIFDVKDLASKDPIKQFDAWFQLARANPGIKEPNAMCIATSTLQGKPSSRMVLLKNFDDKGFTFFTNYNGRKAQELEANPQASLLFYWDVMSRQVRIDGKVRRVSREESDAYFSKRPFNSRVSAYISDQSKVVPNKEYLLQLREKAIEEFGPEQKIPCPDFWGGYLIEPEEFEFWQGNDIRLHDRLRFRRLQEGEKIEENSSAILGEKGWVIERLAP